MPVQVWFSVTDSAQKRENGGAKHALHSLVANFKRNTHPQVATPIRDYSVLSASNHPTTLIMSLKVTQILITVSPSHKGSL